MVLHLQAQTSLITRPLRARQASEAGLHVVVAAGTLSIEADSVGGDELLTSDLTCSAASEALHLDSGVTCLAKVASLNAERIAGSSAAKRIADQNGWSESVKSIEPEETYRLEGQIPGLEAKLCPATPLHTHPRRHRPSIPSAWL